MDSSTVMLVGSSHCTIFPRFQEFLNPLSFIKQTSSSRFTTDIAGAKAGTKKKEEKNPGPDAVSARPPTYAEQRHVLSYLRGAVSLGTGDPRASGLAAAQRAGDAESGAGRDGSARTEQGERQRRGATAATYVSFTTLPFYCYTSSTAADGLS